MKPGPLSEDPARAPIAAGTSTPVLPLARAAHERRSKLLDGLPIGDLSDKVCVDFGVGGRGFAFSYPRLQRCRWAIGIDISRSAVEHSERVSASGTFPYGKRYAYFTARADDLGLKDSTVDVFFAGESIERVENTDAFLDEVHRVLKPGGTLILAGLNADAYLYRLTAERYGMGAEHVSLMSYSELLRYLEPRFEVKVAKGFNASLHHRLDERIDEPEFARAWATQLDDRPDLATNFVLVARRRDDYRPSPCAQRAFPHGAPHITYEGAWHVVPLHAALTARLTSDADRGALALEFEGTDILVFFWSHDWSGRAFVEIDGVARHVELYAPRAGFRRVHVGALARGWHRLRVYGSRDHHPRSRSHQLIFWRAVGYQRRDGAALPRRPEDTPMDIRPGRFGIVYSTSAEMTFSERVLLYGLVFALRPQRCLEIGTHRGGSSLIISAALDDLGRGYLVCVDPQPAVAPELWERMSHRATLIVGPSPEVLPRALGAARGPFDFALIDGDHEFPGVLRDIEGVLPFLADTAYLIFHDAHYFPVRDAIDYALREHARVLTDCGMVSTEETPEDRAINGRRVIWGGLRLLCYRARR